VRNRHRFGYPLGLFVGVIALALSPACGTDPRPDRGRYLPEPDVSFRAIEEALRAWQNSPRIERTATVIRPIMFVEQQQPPGQRLRGFDILGETPGYEDEGIRRFLVRLSLADPEDSVVAAYYVFGQGPVWVYRSEDFDMIMHMDKAMMPAPPPPGGASVSGPGT
jgi:hypothetical protein